MELSWDTSMIVSMIYKFYLGLHINNTSDLSDNM